jgi:hypothetical protein
MSGTPVLRALPWQQRGRYDWFARLGTESFYLAFDQSRKDDWCALRAHAGKPFAHVNGPELRELVEDLKVWIRSSGGEIPKAPEGSRG